MLLSGNMALKRAPAWSEGAIGKLCFTKNVENRTSASIALSFKSGFGARKLPIVLVFSILAALAMCFFPSQCLLQSAIPMWDRLHQSHSYTRHNTREKADSSFASDMETLDYMCQGIAVCLFLRQLISFSSISVRNHFQQVLFFFFPP